MFLRNVHLSPKYTPLQPARPCSGVATMTASNATIPLDLCQRFAGIRIVFCPDLSGYRLSLWLYLQLNISDFQYVMGAFFQSVRTLLFMSTFQPHLTFVQFMQLRWGTSSFVSDCARISVCAVYVLLRVVFTFLPSWLSPLRQLD
jgi:hypothetical protein